MQLEPQVKNPYQPITPAEATAAAHNDGWYADDPALRLVVQDAERAEEFAASKAFVAGWSSSLTLYQSQTGSGAMWPNGVPKANVPFYTVATAVNSIVPQIVNGLFYDEQPFMTQNRPGTTAEAARAVADVIAYQLGDIGFREQLRLGIVNATLFGTGVWKWGWEKFTRHRKVYKLKNPPTAIPSPVPGQPPVLVQDDDIEETIEEEVVDRPTFEHLVKLREVLVDPGLNVPDIRKAKYVIHRMYMTWKELEKLRERPGFDIPSKEKLLELFLPPQEPAEFAPGEQSQEGNDWTMQALPRYEDTTANVLEQPLEVLERWDNETYTVVLQKKLVICNDENPYGKIPFVSTNWWDVPDSFWGLGIGRTIGAEQRLQQGITNVWLDQASINLNGAFVRVRGKSVPTGSIRLGPGAIIEVDSKDDFKPLDRVPAVPEAQQHLILSQARAEQVSGANEAASQGIAGTTGHSNLARSAAGANLIASGSGNRVSDFVDKLADQVIVPFLYEVYEMNRAMLPVSQLRYILSDELEHAYLSSGGNIVDLLNARVKFSILAGAKIQAKQKMLQMMPLLTQFLTNQQTENQLALQGLKVDIAEIIRTQFQLADFKNYNDIIVPMTDQDNQRWQQMQPGAAKQVQAESAQQLQQQKFQQQQMLVDQENEGRAARDILREQFKAGVEGKPMPGVPEF